MTDYKQRRNYVDHNFNTTTLTINNTHKAEGLESLAVERTEDEVTVQNSSDGMAIFSEVPSLVGTITFSILEASATNDIMWEHDQSKTQIALDVKDTASPNLDCRSAKSRIVKAPTIERGREQSMVEWVCVCTYLDVKGGSYALASA